MKKAFGIDNPGVALAASIGSVLLIRMFITFNNFVLARRYRSELPLHFRIGWWQACRLFLTEFKATMTSSSWTMPFRTFTRRNPHDPEGLPVLLIHGYGCNSGYWHSMSKALVQAKIVHYAVDMEPVIGGIDEYVPIIHEAIERISNETGHDKVILVGHSMGGLVARAYLRVHGSERIAKVITLGTPHHGTGLAHFGVGLNTQQMRWTATEQEGLASDWLRDLAASEGADIYRLFVSIYSHHDNIISPQRSSHLAGAKNIEFHAIGHVALGLDPVIQAQVIREIRRASRVRKPPIKMRATKEAVRNASPLKIV
ncbi:MAG TPA: alpha/beta fold hydrolase [Noviherbaspirillum sp.]|nr:alpha/beta fold hydrolase [Noviherbaspirillum sp.]